ncbi:hypothetical protein AQ490_23330 [Wenjunlia vitaminophila]|uniref:DNA 3'-5' helicase n=1 Tax=Wenjunlia vitaminophila TaxID=76728 RepID=A0A0T6LSW0_WENVI|nr:hypothetical protein AQ490_23330 [Wenjunlia vitaminophila]
MDPTPEQAEAVAAYGDGIDLVLQAGAGCGKSSTLKMIARSDPQARMVYIAYNRSIATDAQKSFPTNATCATAHSLAFHAVGKQYAGRLGGPRQTAHDAAQILDVPRLCGVPAGVPRIVGDLGQIVAMPSRKIMRTALETVTRFCYSADPEITAAHLPRRPNLRLPKTLQQLGELVLPVARAAWTDLCRPDGRLKFQHDHYLKLWALGGPRLAADVVLLDEAQDTNDVLADVIRRQEHAQRIVVGDSAQQIYQWRGANDALAKFTADGAQQLTLSRSFRFGPAVADEANRWLFIIDAPLRLIGHDPVPSVVGPVDSPDAILCRTNAGAMAVVMDALKAGRKAALVGGGGDMQRLARAAAALMAGRETDHPELAGFSSWQQVRDYCEQEPDGQDLRVLVQLVDAHGADAIIATTEQLAGEDVADLVVSTAHRSKGREWDRVRVHSDFRAPSPDPKTGHVTIRREEARLAYVAVTRARLALDAAALAWVSTVTAVTG